MTNHLGWIAPKGRIMWVGICRVMCVGSVRHLPGEEAVRARRHWLSSLPPEATRLLALVRGYLAIENRCHWVMT
ncbi:hypothetical protein HZ994_04210 [Akkermansiaceae bacterium]|nr:hypothetical protein HZ994_04210 [Akkermansiaceae bacterium]